MKTLPLLLLCAALSVAPALAAEIERPVPPADAAGIDAVQPLSAALGGAAVLSVAAAPLPLDAAGAPALAPAATPAAGSVAAPSRAASRIPRSPSGRARAFKAFISGLAAAHAPLGEALAGGRIFDGTSVHEALAAAVEGRFGALPRATRLAPSPRHVSVQSVAEGAAAAPGIALDADPKDEASVEKALRALVDSDPAKYGAPSAQLARVSVSILPSIQPGQGASIIAVFRQEVAGADKGGASYELSVSGKSLTFHVKVLGGKPVVMSESGELASGVTSDVMTVAFDDAQLDAIAAKRALSPADPLPGSEAGGGKAGRAQKAPAEEPAPAAPTLLTRELTDELGGKWRAVNVYQAADPKGRPVIVFVDVKSGEAFAFSAEDLRAGGKPSGRRSLISGTVSGRATLPGADGADDGPIGPIPLPLTNVYDEKGEVVAVTDEKGSFSIPDNGASAPVKLTIRLASPLVPFVKDEDAAKNKPIEITVLATPGETMSVMLNPASDDPEEAANIVGYVGYLNHHLWVKGLPGMDAARMDVPLAGGIVVNGHEQQGNAYYNPSNDSVNLMAAAVITVHDSHGKPVELKVENTAVWSIEDHEDTHRVVQIYSQIQLTLAQLASPVYRFVKWSMDTIMGSDVNESIADAVSYFMRKSPKIGAGFYGNPPKGQPNYIRSAEDKTPYDPKNPDPHNGVLAQAMWAARQGFIDKLGPAPGEAYADAMIPLILISQPLNPIDALFHMVLWDLREDGGSPFGDLIRRIAKDDHGIDLPAVPAAPVPAA